MGWRGAAARRSPEAVRGPRALVRRARWRLAHEPEAGSWVTTAVAAMFAPVLIIMAGLAFDSAAQVASAQRARWVAADAARAAANAQWAASASDDAWSADSDQARQVARQWIQAANGGTDNRLSVQDVRVEDTTVTVTVTGAYDTIFLGIIGIDQLHFTVTKSATAVQVIDGQAVP